VNKRIARDFVAATNRGGIDMSSLLNIQLTNKVAIVTGAGMGVGEGIAKALGEAGAHVVCNARIQSDIDRTAAAIRGKGRRTLAVAGDVTKSEDLDNLVAHTIQEFGRVDILINNAGMSRRQFIKAAGAASAAMTLEGVP
jgi:NAD(P)-dependent dehydrogenase (short-subunit alcohol dehydrogenase family)